jgi:hypothetical protein
LVAGGVGGWGGRWLGAAEVSVAGGSVAWV